MIIDNLDLLWTWGVFWPFKAYPPLIVDANAVLSLPIALQRFQSVYLAPPNRRGAMLNRAGLTELVPGERSLRTPLQIRQQQIARCDDLDSLGSSFNLVPNVRYVKHNG